MKKFIVTFLFTIILSINSFPVQATEYIPCKYNLTKAQAGEAYYQFIVGVGYAGFGKYDPDEEKAVYWLEKAGTKGQVEAYNALGIMYTDLIIGSNPFANNKRAIQYFSKSPNCKNSAYMIGNLYKLGIGNIKRNYKVSMKWLNHAVKLNNEFSVDAAYLLAQMFEEGKTKTKEKNLEKAIEWYEYAAKLGKKEASKKAEKLKKRLSGNSFFFWPF